MSGETAERESGWTTDTLKSYFERIFLEKDERLNERFAAQENAITKAEASLIEQMRGFPEEYAKVITVDLLRSAFEEIKNDHVQRREVEDLKKFQWKILGALAFGVIFIPFITGMLVYLLTRHAVPLTPPAGG